MARKPFPPSMIGIAAAAGFAMLLIAIIVRNFWLSLVFGVVGTGTFVLAAILLREYRRGLPDKDKSAH
jgi:hypothetical protein